MRYIIPASDLYQKAKEILNAGMDYVEISFMEPDDDLPAAVHFQAWKKNADHDEDFEEIDIVDSAD
jgi:hypothetical protein